MKPLEAVITRTIWDVDLASLPIWRAQLTRAARIVHAVSNDILEGQLTLRAMSLVYTTLLSTVPVLALAFSVLKGFGVHSRNEQFLTEFLAPLGARGAEIAQTIVGFVDNMKVGVLGVLGLAILLWTTISMIQKIERALNYTWHTVQTRSLSQRISK